MKKMNLSRLLFPHPNPLRKEEENFVFASRTNLYTPPLTLTSRGGGLFSAFLIFVSKGEILGAMT